MVGVQPAELGAYVADLHEDQAAAVLGLHALVTAAAPDLGVAVNDGKWLRGLIFFSAGPNMVYAVGPKGTTKTVFHMMPFYGSPVLQERHGPALAPFLTGKSCITFRRFDDLPAEALTDIVGRGTPVFVQLVTKANTDR